MRRANRVLVVSGVLAIGLGAWARAASAAEEGRGSVKIPFPKEESVKVGFVCNKVEVRSVKVESAPSRHEIKEAREHRSHRDDTAKLRWIFELGNEGKHKRKVTLEVKVLAKGGDVLAKDSRTDTVSGETETDRISVWTTIRLLDYARAHHARISGECERE